MSDVDFDAANERRRSRTARTRALEVLQSGRELRKCGLMWFAEGRGGEVCGTGTLLGLVADKLAVISGNRCIAYPLTRANAGVT